MKKLLLLAAFSAIAAMLFWGVSLDKRQGWQEPSLASQFLEGSSGRLSMPVLEDEDSPFFSRQTLVSGTGGSLQVLKFRKDQSQARLHFGKSGLLESVEVWNQEQGKENMRLAYRAIYDASGRRIQHSEQFDSMGQPETKVERAADGSETFSFFRQGSLIRKTEHGLGGVLSIDYKNGVESARRLEAHQESSQDLIWWDKEKTKLRLRVKQVSGRLDSCEYFSPDSQLEHTVKVQPDSSLLFSYFEKGKLKRRQTWSFLGEDWERAYYGLSYCEALADDEKTVEHKVWLRSSGSLKRHERFNGKTGKLEMERTFDRDGRVDYVRDFKESGESKQVWIFPISDPRSRGFVPTGMRSYPGGDEKIGFVYNLNGSPFARALSDRQPWQFLSLPR